MKTDIWPFDYDIYVLKNKDRYYVGISENAEIRYQSHLKGKCRSSSKLGDPNNLVLIHKWKSPNYLLASKLERFCHNLQKKKGEDIILTIIQEMPTYTLEMKQAIHNILPTTDQERILTRHLTESDLII
jgi:predicted GIY-YIG superfamily endonuclease